MSDNHQMLNEAAAGQLATDGMRIFGYTPPQPPFIPSSTNPLENLGDVRHVAFLSEDIGSLYLNDSYSDIVLVVNGVRFQAHKVILAARSEYFRALLFGGMRESSQNEVELTENNVDAFKMLLRYIYTGRLSLNNHGEDAILEILGLAHKYGFDALESSIIDYLKSILSVNNLCTIFGASHLYSLSVLSRHCLHYADRHASELLTTPGFLQLQSFAVHQLISRDSFSAPEIEIFRAAAEWVRANGETEAEPVLSQIRLSLMTLDDLLNIVRPSALLSPDSILDAIKEQSEKRGTDLRYRGFMIPESNVATAELGAEVIEGELKQFLLNGDVHTYDMERGFSRHPIEDRSEGIIVQLGATYIVNHIQLLLWDRDPRSYSYYVDVSVDKQNWVRVVDYSMYLCRSWQKLYFPAKVVKYIRVCGTHNTVNRVFHLVHLEAIYANSVPALDNYVIVPNENIATTRNSASVIEGVSRSRNALINGDVTNYDWDSGYTCHQLGSGAIVIQLPQPYAIDSMRLLLWDCDERSYSYYIETSVDSQNWRLVADKTKEACKSWQILHFDRQVVAFIRIVGTHNTANEVFHCVHFECPITENAHLQTGAPSSSSASSSQQYQLPPLQGRYNAVRPLIQPWPGMLPMNGAGEAAGGGVAAASAAAMAAAMDGAGDDAVDEDGMQLI